MGIIIALFTEYLKPILIGIASIMGIFFISKVEDLKAENQILNDNLSDENKVVEAQNEVIAAINNATPVSFDAQLERMRENKL